MESLSDSGSSEKPIGERLDIQKEENSGRREAAVLMASENLRKISICKICCDAEGF